MQKALDKQQKQTVSKLVTIVTVRQQTDGCNPAPLQLIVQLCQHFVSQPADNNYCAIGIAVNHF